MAKLTDIHARHSGAPQFLCDFSPPRGAHYNDIDAARALNAHCLSVPYNPGRSVYANAALAAYTLKSRTGREVAFTIATRDMNILAAESLLVGSALVGLQNVIVVRGDDFTPAELRSAKPVHDRTTTALIRSIAGLNQGSDFRGRPIGNPTDFCIGASLDTNRDIDSEAALTRRKIEAGAHFLITQPAFSPASALRFIHAYEQAYGAPAPAPIFFGVQMIGTGGRSFSLIPQSVQDALNAGISPADIAIQTISLFIEAGISTFYLLPPILPGGARDYRSAAHVLNRFRTDIRNN